MPTTEEISVMDYTKSANKKWIEEQKVKDAIDYFKHKEGVFWKDQLKKELDIKWGAEDGNLY